MADMASSEIRTVASEVFDTLAKGRDLMSLEEFTRCSTILGQLSQEFASAPAQAFQRIDTNNDSQLQREEFVGEVQKLADRLGVQKVLEIVAEVKSVASQFGQDMIIADEDKQNTLVPAPVSGFNQGLGLDIKPKPLHPRGERERIRNIRAREKVMEKMILHFRSLEEEYAAKLAQAQLEEKQLINEDADAALVTPRGTKIFADVKGRAEMEAIADAEEKEKETKRKAYEMEAKAAMKADVANEDGGAGAQDVADPEEDEGKDEDAEDEEIEEDPEDLEDEEDDDVVSSPPSSSSEEESNSDDEDGLRWDGTKYVPEAEYEAQKAKAALASAEAAEAVLASAAAAKQGAETTAAEEDPTATPAAEPGELTAVPAATEKEVTAVAAAEGEAASTPAAEVEAATAPEIETSGKSELGSNALVADGEAAAAAEMPKIGEAPPRKTKTKKEKKAKRERPPKSAAAADPSSSPRPIQPPPRSPRQVETSESAAAPTPKALALKAKGKLKLDEEGVSMVQELDMGKAIRSAICIGREVWCADWQGKVTIRERDDASKVKAEIPTNRFIWCMAHMAPGIMWMGQESMGISLFNSSKKQFDCLLEGGHTGGITCLALDEALGDEVDDGTGRGTCRFPVRRGWSGSNDFTIRQWWIETWKNSDPTPESIAGVRDAVIIKTRGGLKVGISKGMAMYGHTNGVRALLRIGPTVWSGSDDGSIRIWSSSEGTCSEVVEDAHKGSVLKLTVVRSFVWSAGADGLIKEWQIGGDTATRCLRHMAPPGFEKSVYAIVPLGRDVWTCGHHPDIKVMSQAEMKEVTQYPAHNPYVSNIMAVDRVETRIVWSTSVADRKLKVWRHTVRGNVPSFDELKAANKLYELEEATRGERMNKLNEQIAGLKEEINLAGEEYKSQLDSLAQQLAEEKAARDALEEAKKFLEAELAGLRLLFEEAGLGHLLDDPEALRNFLDLKRLFDEAGLGHLLQDKDALKKFLSIGKAFEEAGLGRLLGDPDALKAFLLRAGQIEQILKDLGLQDALMDPSKLKQMLESFLKLKQVLEKYGFGDAIQDASKLDDILSRYTALKAAFEGQGFADLFEDPTKLKAFLENYALVRAEFRNIDLEHLMDSAPAMKEFLVKHCQNDKDLIDLKNIAEKCRLLEGALQKTKASLKQALADIEQMKALLKQYTDLCPDIATLLQWKDEAMQYRGIMKMKKDGDKEIDELRRLLEQKERERQEALAKEREMSMKYKELDIFKLDIIARELKSLDNELGAVGKSVKELQIDGARLKDYGEQQQIMPHGDHIMDQCKDLRGHIKDVINKCLSETQKMHIGAAIDDPSAAGSLQDGGVMAGFVVTDTDGRVTEVDVPDYGSSVAGKLRHDDEMRREGATLRPSSKTPSRAPSPRWER